MMKRFNLQSIFPIAGLIVAIYLGIILIQTVKKNYDLNQQIGKLEKQVADMQNEQDELKYKVQYYQTEAFKEKEARAKLGLQAPGEGVIYLPKQQASEDTAKTKAKKTKSNPAQWWEFIFG